MVETPRPALLAASVSRASSPAQGLLLADTESQDFGLTRAEVAEGREAHGCLGDSGTPLPGFYCPEQRH